MFTNVGWGELLLIGVVALVVLGPERLPEAARWLTGAMRKVKDFAGTAQQQLKDDFGADFDEIREPLSQLNELRGMTPRALVTKHLLDGDESLLTGNFADTAPAADAGGPGTAGAAPMSKEDIYRQSSADRAAAGGAPAARGNATPAAPAAPPAAPSTAATWDSDAT